MKFKSILIAACAALLAGCATAPTTTQLALISAASMDGTFAVLQSNPQDAPTFDAAYTALNTLGTSDNLLSYSTIEAVLTDTGQTNAAVKLAVANVIPLADAYIGTNTTTVAVQSAAVKSVLVAVAGGIKSGEQLANVK